MKCTNCNSESVTKKGIVIQKNKEYQRYKCNYCDINFKVFIKDLSDIKFVDDTYPDGSPIKFKSYESDKEYTEQVKKDFIQDQEPIPTNQTYFCLIENTTIPFELRVKALDPENAAKIIFKSFIDSMNHEQQKRLTNTIIHVFDTNNNKTIFHAIVQFSISFYLDNLSNTQMAS